MKLKFFLKLFIVPTFVSLFFLIPLIFSQSGKIAFVNALNKSTNELSVKFEITNDEGKFFDSRKNYFLPDKQVFQILKLPIEMGEYDFCISQKSFAIDTDEKNVPADNILQISTGGTVVMIDADTQTCSDDFEPGKKIVLVGFSFNDTETRERILKWGLDREGYKYLYGLYEVKFSIKPKNSSFYLLLPLAILYIWWASILFYYKVKKEVKENTTQTTWHHSSRKNTVPLVKAEPRPSHRRRQKS